MNTARTYWNGSGRYQGRYDAIKRLVPAEGRASTPHGQLLTDASSVYCDAFSNGGRNFGSGVSRQLAALLGARDHYVSYMTRPAHVDEFRVISQRIADWHERAWGDDGIDPSDHPEFYVSLEAIMDAVILYVAEEDGKNETLLVASRRLLNALGRANVDPGFREEREALLAALKGPE